MRANSPFATDFLPRLVRTLTRTWALALIWLVVALYATRFALFKLPVPPHYTDFNQYYVAALSARKGEDPYLSNLYSVAHAHKLTILAHSSNQPPTLLLIVEPLTGFDPHTAYWIRTGISAAALAVALWLLMSLTSLTTRQALLFGALYLLYPPVYEHFYFSNMQLIITLLLVMTMYCLGRGAERGAGLALALAAALKMFPVLLVAYLICRGRWRVLFWMVGFGGVIGLLTLGGMGMVSFSFLRSIASTTSRQTLDIPGFFSISSMVSRAFWYGSESLSPLMDMTRTTAVAVAELALFALTVSATAGSGADCAWRAFSLWVVAMILLSPIAEPHYLVMLMIPFAWIADAAARGAAAPRAIYAAIASYLIAFSRYPLALLQRYRFGSAGFFRAANNFWFLAIVCAYLAAYWLATSARQPRWSAGSTPNAVAAAD